VWLIMINKRSTMFVFAEPLFIAPLRSKPLYGHQSDLADPIVTITSSPFSFDQVRHVPEDVLGPDLHAKRGDSLSDVNLGVLHSATLALAAIGAATTSRGTCDHITSFNSCVE
jgi:hypothetical protein